MLFAVKEIGGGFREGGRGLSFPSYQKNKKQDAIFLSVGVLTKSTHYFIFKL